MKKLFIIAIITLIQSIFISHDVFANSGIHQPKKISLSTGVTMEYVEQSESLENTILFVHGFTDSWHSFENVLKLLPANIHAIAVTLRGHGNSSKQGSSFTVPDFAADLKAFITTKKLKNVVLAGHSLGGLVIQQFVLDYPQLTRAVIITSSAASFKDNPGIPEFVAAINEISDPIPY
jgi:non-heme chloroperoxidase